VPILREAMRDSMPLLRISAIQTAAELGRNAAELIPDLLALQNDQDRHVRRAAIEALHRMDPELFPMPRPVGD